MLITWLMVPKIFRDLTAFLKIIFATLNHLVVLDCLDDIISASADGGPRSRVWARETLRSAPH
jgi:hypothetical protein